MRVEPRAIDKDRLGAFLEDEYGVTSPTLTFLPEGEESYVYVATEPEGDRSFIRVTEDFGQRGSLETAYTAVETLAQREKLSALVAPRRRRRGAFLGAFRGFLVALFPFIEGKSLYGGASSEDRAGVAQIVATLHDTNASNLGLPRVGLENPFQDPIQRALRHVESPIPKANRYQERIVALLNAHREDVEHSLRKMEAWKAQEQTLVGESVLTHGEPHLDNVVKDSYGGLRLTDCGDLAVGPSERDLFAFTGPDLEWYLRSYLRRRRTIHLSPSLFEFYFYRWALQEIADYTNRILFRDMGPEEDEHSWRELQPYLPTRHDEIARAMRRVRGVLANFSS